MAFRLDFLLKLERAPPRTLPVFPKSALSCVVTQNPVNQRPMECASICHTVEFIHLSPFLFLLASRYKNIYVRIVYGSLFVRLSPLRPIPTTTVPGSRPLALCWRVLSSLPQQVPVHQASRPSAHQSLSPLVPETAPECLHRLPLPGPFPPNHSRPQRTLSWLPPSQRSR